MIVKASIATEVELNETVQRQVFFALIERVFNWKSDYFIQSGMVRKISDHYSSHSFSITNDIRVASELDYAVEKVVAQIKQSKP